MLSTKSSSSYLFANVQ